MTNKGNTLHSFRFYWIPEGVQGPEYFSWDLETWWNVEGQA